MDKKCECGCGQTAPIADQTDRRIGAKRGEPRRYVWGHNRRLRYLRAQGLVS